ncbi:hypothetical protein F4814DRAFT_459454 [Daldinia grandis]|nr:hypothetical protein F4814DRAFT_459454 [Daldinia grandis]
MSGEQKHDAREADNIQGAQAADLEQLEQRRRLDEIVKDHIDDSGIISDRPGFEIPGNSHDDSWMMAGGLVTSALQGLWDTTMSTSGPSSLRRDCSNNGQLRVADQGTSNLTRAPTFQGYGRPTLPGGILNTMEASSPNPSTPTSSPTLHTMQARRCQAGNSAHLTQLSGPLPPRYSNRIMPTVAPTFTPATFYGNTQVSGPNQEEADEDEDDYYAGPVNGDVFGVPTSYSTIQLQPQPQPQPQTQLRVGPYPYRPSVSSQRGLRPVSTPIPQPIDDLVVLIGIPGVGGPGSSRRCQGRCINRRVGLAQALARDRLVLQKEKELWTMMMGF